MACKNRPQKKGENQQDLCVFSESCIRNGHLFDVSAQFLQLANSGRLQDMLSGQAPMPAVTASGKETDAEEDNEEETDNEEEDFLDEENE